MPSPLHNRRALIFAAHQHPYRHTLNELAFSHPAFGDDVTNLEQAMNWLIAVLYPNMQDPVATVGDLPAVGNTLLDMRVVNDDGDGKAASYRWEQREGEATPSWHKIYDMDWGFDSILSGFELHTQDLYVSKYGRDDIDAAGALLAGTDAGQHVFGGKAANSHLTLWANSGDGVGAPTGYIQMGDNVRPKVDSVISLGTNAERWLKVWTDEITVGTMTIAGGSVTDSGGLIDFDDENLTTDGYITAGTLRIEGGSITDSSGAIDFGDENVSMDRLDVDNIRLDVNTISVTDVNGNLTLAANGTGVIIASHALQAPQLDVDNLRLDGNTLSSTNTDGNVIIAANGVGVVNVTSPMTTVDQDVTGIMTVIGQIDADNLRLDGNTLASTDANGHIRLDPNGTGDVITHARFLPSLETFDLGASANRWNDFYVNGSISNATNSITVATLMTLRDINAGVASGDTIFWDGTKWVASNPDTEIVHSEIGGLGADDHIQYALLAGRAGGQTLRGGTAASDNLTLESTSNASKGDVIWIGDLLPGADVTYDIGHSGARVKDIYMSGQARGMRLENFTTAGRPAAGNAGRIIYDTDLKDSLIDDGATWRSASINYVKVVDTTGWNGSANAVSYDVSSYNVDARDMIWCLKNNSANFEQMTGGVITHTGANNVTVTFGVDFAPAAGTYTLLGVG